MNVEPSMVNVAAIFPFSSVTLTISVFLSLIMFSNTLFEIYPSLPTVSVTVLSDDEITEPPTAVPLGVSIVGCSLGVSGSLGVLFAATGRAPTPAGTTLAGSRNPLRLIEPSAFLVKPVNSSDLNHEASATTPELLSDLEPFQ